MRLQSLIPRSENGKALIGGGIYSLVLLFFLSPDSYLRDGFWRCDSAWFYTCGKAWMNGMVPYVDFSDWKGPLLWLIYGVGYLLNDHSYVGVFWMSIPFYTATLFIAYKLCRLFVDAKVAAIAVSFFPFFLLNSYYHYEVRAEDFCYTFIMLAMYCTCYTMKHRDAPAATHLRIGLAMGAACMCCVLIKWNIALMIMSLMAVTLYDAWRGKALGHSFAGMVAGFIAPALPFVVCFLVYGNLDDFIREYFLMTFDAVQRRSGMGTSLMSIVNNFFGNEKKLLLFLVAVVALFSWRYKAGWRLLFCLLCFRLVKGDHCYAYTYMPMLCFTLFLLITIADWLRVCGRFATSKVVMSICVLGAALSIGYNIVNVNRLDNRDSKARQNNCVAAYIMSQIRQPRLLYCFGDYGCGIFVDGLPACKYWAYPWGCNDNIMQQRKLNLESGVADFVFTQEDFDWEGLWTRRYIESCGYTYYTKMVALNDTELSVFGRPGLRMPPSDFHVTQWDVWLKRDIFGVSRR